MSDINRPDKVSFTVKNFGPIAEAKVDLRPLTILIGPSNTGKSYFAMLVYALSRCLSDASISDDYGGHRIASMRSNLPHPISLSHRSGKPWSNDEEKNALMHWVRSSVTESEARLSPLPTSLNKSIRRTITNGWIPLRNVKSHIEECFGTGEGGIQQLRRQNSSGDGHIRISQERNDDLLASMDIPLSDSGTDIKFRLKQSFIPKLTDSHTRGPFSARSFRRQLDKFLGDTTEIDEQALRTAFRLICRSIIPPFEPLTRMPYYLPASRTGIMHTHQAVVSTLLRRATDGDLHDGTPIPKLPAVSANFLIDLINMSRRTGPLASVSQSMESEVLGGEVLIERTLGTGYPAYYYLPDNWNHEDRIPLRQASTMVSELAPIILYLRHIVTPNRWLIIEEPEAHLHPGMQAELAIQLAKLIRHGVRVIITTHSEIILEQFLNLIQLSNFSDARCKKVQSWYPRLAGASLAAHEVGAWLFNLQSPQKSIVEEVEPDFEAGTFPVNYMDVSLALYNDWQDMYNRLVRDE